MGEKAPGEFERAASGAADESILAEFWAFLRHSKKWWLVPIFSILLLYGLLVLVYGTAAAPFIYTLF